MLRFEADLLTGNSGLQVQSRGVCAGPHLPERGTIAYVDPLSLEPSDIRLLDHEKRNVTVF